MNHMFDTDFYKGKRVLVTGHTGFKGAWLCKILVNMGAKVIGYSLEPPTSPSLYEIAEIGKRIKSITGDVRNYEVLKQVFDETRPDIVFHLAAQSIVSNGYKNPRGTYETNVMGTVNILECVRNCSWVRSVIIVTTDKVYLNKEWNWGYRENEELNGHDPYSNSKSCAELATGCYKNSFFYRTGNSCATSISTVRAGNVIGGGDFAPNRIIPDCIRAAVTGRSLEVRNPHSTRPYQHVLEPLFAYLMIAAAQYNDNHLAGSYNVGPDEKDCICTAELADLFARYWGEDFQWVNKSDQSGQFHEANSLKLDCAKLKAVFGWKPHWNIETAIEKTVEWEKYRIKKYNVGNCMDEQIREYLI